MKLSITTEKLQNLVARSLKGSSNNKMLPLTTLMCIELKDNKLTLTTTDGTNYLYIKADKIAGDDFYVVVPTDIFSKLVSRLTCETVEMELKDDVLVVNGNGKYMIELPIDEEGNLIKYPNPLKFVTDTTNPSKINLSTVKLILSTAKASLATTMDIPCYTGYYMGDKIITTDTCRICGINIHLWDESVLLNPAMIDLLDVMVYEFINVYRQDNIIVFDTEDCTVYGKTMDSIEDYQIQPITFLLNDEYSSSCKIYRNQLLQLLDRLILFVSPYDKNVVVLTFTREGIRVASKQANSAELIEYYSSNNFTNDFTCQIDIENFRSQVKANIGDMLEIHYGKTNAIKLVDGTITQIVALSDE